MEKWRLQVDQPFVKFTGKHHYLWRAADHEGEVPEAAVRKRPNMQAALKLLRKLMWWYGHPEQAVTDRFLSYRAALRAQGLSYLQATGHWPGNGVETSRQPI